MPQQKSLSKGDLLPAKNGTNFSPKSMENFSKFHLPTIDVFREIFVSFRGSMLLHDDFFLIHLVPK